MSGNLGGAQSQAAVEDFVGFGNELHVAILDAVVHHLDEVAGAVRSDVGDAWPGIALGRDGIKNRGHVLVRLAVASGHERRPVAGAFFAAGDAHAEEVDHALAAMARAEWCL